METAQIVGLFLETLMFGVFVMTYSKGAWLLLRGDQPSELKRRNWYLLAANSVMFIASVIVSQGVACVLSQFLTEYPVLQHVALTVFITTYVLVTQDVSRDDVFEAFESDKWNAINAAQYVLYVTQGLIGDGFMVSIILSVTLPFCLSYVCSCTDSG